MTDEELIRECQKRFRLSLEAENSDRGEALIDLKFGNGDQWPVDIKRDREIDGRPCITINITDAMVRRVSNACRENRPRIKCHPVGSGADVQSAKVYNGIIRHIETGSNADHAYDTAVESAIRGGWGYFRVGSKYVDDMSFDQDLMIERIRNPFTVYKDPSSHQPDGSDMRWCLISDLIPKDEFESTYGKIDPASFTLSGEGDSVSNWSTKEEIRIAEYWKIEPRKATIVMLPNGQAVEKKDLPPELQGKKLPERETQINQVKWFLVTINKVLDRRDWPGKYIPIIPVYGRELDINGKVSRKGMIRDMRDPARMYNYSETSKTEAYGLQPKAPWMGPDGATEGHEAAWRDANRKPIAYLPYKPTQAPDGSMNPPPQRQMPPQVAAGFQEWSQSTANNFMMVAGMPNEPGADAKGEVVSGIAIKRRQGLADISHYDFYDNLTRSLRHAGKIIIELIPHFYDAPRMQRIIGDDGTPDMVPINQPQQSQDPQTGQIIQAIKNDVTVGKYDVVVDTGPGYQTKREEGAAAMLELLATPLGEMTAHVAGDVVVRSMDFPDADTIADRMAAMIPGAQIDKNSDIPPKAQMFIKSLQAQLAQANQRTMALELELKAGHQKEHIRQDAETERTKLKLVSTDTNTDKKLNVDLAKTHVQAITAHDVAEINVTGKILDTHVAQEHEKAMTKEALKDADQAYHKAE